MVWPKKNQKIKEIEKKRMAAVKGEKSDVSFFSKKNTFLFVYME